MKKKRMISLVVALSLILAFIPVLYVQAVGATTWEWQTEAVYEGWVHNNQIDATCVADGWYTLHIPGTEDPNITSPAISIDTSMYKTLEITYRNQTGNSNARLYWRNDGEGFSESKAVSFMTYTDGNVHTCQVNLAQLSNWTGTVTQIRLDPTTGGNGNFAIDSIRFSETRKPEGKLSQEWQWCTDNNTLGWRSNEQIDAICVANGRYTLHIPNRVDPNITSPTLSIDTTTYQYFEITYKNETGNTDAKLYWARSGEGFSEARALSFSTIADGKWHTLRVDLSSSSAWSGIVTQLRFDPTTGGTGNSELDRLSQIMGYLKGKSSLMIYEKYANLKHKYGNRHFWCRGYYVSTVGRNRRAIEEYIKNQLQEDYTDDQLSIKEFVDPFTDEPVRGGK